MKTKCYSHNGNCPCIDCPENCCIDNTDESDMTDTEKLCQKAKEYCEKCALLAKENEHETH